MILVDLLIVVILIYAAYTGTRRGMVLLALELGSFIIASAAALVAYHLAGGVIKSLAGLPVSLSNVIAFALVWMITEIVCALIIRLTLGHHFNDHLQRSLVN